MTSPAEICVVIAAKDAAATIGRAIRSALAEAEVAEVVVVDDGSADGTGAAALAANDGTGRLAVLPLDRNRGPAFARNHAIDRLRVRRKTTAGIDAAIDIADPTPGPEALAMAGEDSARVHRCLDELDEDRASAVRGAYLKGESYADLAERHDVPLNTMRTWLRRSLIKLRECLER